MPKIEGSQIYLREMIESDWQDVHSYASLEAVCRYQPWGPNSEQQSKEFVKEVVIDNSKIARTRYVYSVILKENNRLIGAGEINIRSSGDEVGEIGYILHPDMWGKGLATIVARKLLEIGFGQLKLHRIYATCDPRNIGSERVLQKVGMTLEGKVRENLRMEDGWRDSLLYGILDREWRIKLVEAIEEDAECLFNMQVKSFMPLLETYKDYNTNPANETMERVIRRINESNSIFYKIIFDEILVGAIRIRWEKNRETCWISPIFILPEYQGNGIAQKAMKLIEKIHPEVVCWELATILEEKRNCYLYEKVGYVQTGVTKKLNENATLVFYVKKS